MPLPSPEAESSWQKITLYLLTIAILILCALILQPFFTTIVAAIVLAVVTQHPYDWLATKIRNPNLCATVALLLVILAIVIPSFFLAQELGQQTLGAVDAFRNEANQQKVLDYIASHPALANHLSTIDPTDAVHASAAYLGHSLGGILGTSVHVITQIIVMLFLLFFLFRDRAEALAFLRTLLPLRDDEAAELLHRLDDTIYATALGRIVIAAVQGVLAGLAYWVLGVPGVILWAFTTAIMALIPAFGTILVWAPIALYLGFTGHWGKALLLALWGGLIVSTIDNFLYPVLVGTRLRAHTATILMSILGGVALFGITGLILGPIIFSIADTLLEFWRARTTASSTTA